MNTSIDQDLLDCIFCTAMCILMGLVFLWGMKQDQNMSNKNQNQN